MPCLRSMDAKIFSKFQRSSPVGFVNGVSGKAPAPEMRTHAERTDDMADFMPEFHDGGIVQMIPVVMGSQDEINIGHVRCGIGSCARKGPCAEKRRGGIRADTGSMRKRVPPI